MQLRAVYQRLRRAVSAAESALREQYSSLGLLRDRRLAILAVANVLDTMSTTIFVPFLPSLAAEIGADPLVTGFIFTAPAVVSAVASTPGGYLSDRWGRRPVISVGVTLSALSVTGLAFAGSPAVLIVLRGFDALFRAFVSPAVTAYIGDVYPEENRGSAFGAYQTSAMIGAAVGPAVGGFIASVFGIRVPFLVLGVGTLLGGVLLLAFLPAADDGNTSGEDGNKGESLDLLPDISRESVGLFLSVPAVAWLCYGFLNELGTTMLDPTFAPLLQTTVGRGAAYAGTTYSIMAVALLVFMPIGGRFADRASRTTVLNISSLGWAVVLIGLAVATSPLVPPVLLFLGGIFSAFAAPASQALRYEIAPDGREATFTGITGAASSVGRAVGPTLAGAMTGLYGVRLTAVVAGISWLVSIPLLVFFIPDSVGSRDD
jgi:MFS family permease